MKKYIFIPDEIDFRPLSYNQSMLLLFALENTRSPNEIKRLLYHKYLSRFLKDKDVNVKYKDVIANMKLWQNERNKIKDKTLIPLYYKMKVETFNKIINNKSIHKIELLIILSLLKLYKITYVRNHLLDIKTFLSDTFNIVNYRQYKSGLINTLDILKNWVYDDGSVFIKSYTINDKKITIILDEKRK